MTNNVCDICSGKFSEPVLPLYQFTNVSSDCRPWHAGRSIVMCESCGVMKRTIDLNSVHLFASIYENYEMFKHSHISSDQLTFSRDSGAVGRTEKILNFIDKKISPSPKTVLDIGSGSGAGLISLAKKFPSALIHGYEPNDRPAERQKNFPDNVTSVLSIRPNQEKKFDLITMFHVFEHIEDVFELLSYLHSIIVTEGHLLIQIPYACYGPFDFIIADHIWHFSQKSLITLLNKANFQVVYMGNEIIKKELTVLAVPGSVTSKITVSEDEAIKAVEGINWLIEYKLFLDKLKKSTPSLAIYGTGPAAAWAGHILSENTVVYIDEDPSRIDSTFNNKPVLPPERIEPSLPVVAPFPSYQASWIAEKNKNLNIILFK